MIALTSQGKPDEVCGCPLNWKEQKKLDTSRVCLEERKSCHDHLFWEKIRRAEIDLSRLNLVNECTCTLT